MGFKQLSKERQHLSLTILSGLQYAGKGFSKRHIGEKLSSLMPIQEKDVRMVLRALVEDKLITFFVSDNAKYYRITANAIDILEEHKLLNLMGIFRSEVEIIGERYGAAFDKNGLLVLCSVKKEKAKRVGKMITKMAMQSLRDKFSIEPDDYNFNPIPTFSDDVDYESVKGKIKRIV